MAGEDTGTTDMVKRAALLLGPHAYHAAGPHTRFYQSVQEGMNAADPQEEWGKHVLVISRH